MGSSNAPRWLSEVTSMLLRTCQLQSSPLIPNIWHASKFVSKLPPPGKASWETFIGFRRWETQKPEGGCRNSRFRAQDLTEVVPETRNFSSFKYQTCHKVCGSEFGAWSSFIPNFGTNWPIGTISPIFVWERTLVSCRALNWRKCFLIVLLMSAKKWIQHHTVPGWSPTPVLSGPQTASRQRWDLNPRGQSPST